VPNEWADHQLHVTITSDGDLLSVRQSVRSLALELGFTATETVGIVTALSEMARNMLTYAGRGEIIVGRLRESDREGIVITARDEGPGIPDVTKALLDGYSTSGGLGMGLPGIKRLMDAFHIVTEPRKGTTVTVEKWLNHR
jgi:serine/threonine-protein kinase RsbT